MTNICRMIETYASRGNMEAVQKWTTELRSFSTLDSTQLAYWMQACANMESPELAQRYFNIMTREFKVVPNESVYGWMLVTFAKCGRTELLEYPIQLIKIKSLLWRTVLC